MAARQNGHCGAWSGMLHTALAHGMHILYSSRPTHQCICNTVWIWVQRGPSIKCLH